MMTAETYDCYETAMRNGRRDAANYAITAPDEIFTETWTLTHKGDASRRYLVETDTAGVPHHCNCESATKNRTRYGADVCKHQYILSDHLALLAAEDAFENAEDLYAKL